MCLFGALYGWFSGVWLRLWFRAHLVGEHKHSGLRRNLWFAKDILSMCMCIHLYRHICAYIYIHVKIYVYTDTYTYTHVDSLNVDSEMERNAVQGSSHVTTATQRHTTQLWIMLHNVTLLSRDVIQRQVRQRKAVQAKPRTSSVNDCKELCFLIPVRNMKNACICLFCVKRVTPSCF